MEMSSGSIDCSKESSKVMEDLIPSSDNVMNSGQSQTLFPSDSSMSSHSFTNSNVNRLVADVNDLHLNTLSLTPNQKDVIIQEYAKFIYSTIQNENYFKEKGILFDSLSQENKMNYIKEDISSLYDNYLSYKLFHDTIISYVKKQLNEKILINNFGIEYLMKIVAENKEMSIMRYLINGVKDKENNNDFLDDPDFIFENDTLYQAIKPNIVELFHSFCLSKEEIINKVMEEIQTNINN